jgi:hypothetical protein
MLLVAIVGLLSGCVAHGVRDRDSGMYYPDRDHDHSSHRGDPENSDRDRDGVPDRQDRRPDDPRRY